MAEFKSYSPSAFHGTSLVCGGSERRLSHLPQSIHHTEWVWGAHTP